MKRTFFIFSLLLVVSLAVFAGGDKEEMQEEKVLHRYSVAKLQPFDPTQISDLYTHTVYGDIGENLYRYKYLADTYQLEPCIALEMPKVSADGLTYTIKLRKDAYFYDPLKEVFPEGKGRAVNAHDFIFSIMRNADPSTQSNGWWLFEGFIEGLDAWGENPDYSKEVSGLKALDDYTIQLKLTKPYPQILYTLAMSFTYPVPKELIDFYGDEWVNYPIGTGPYYYNHDESIVGTQHVLDKNPAWHGEVFPAASTAGSEVKSIIGADVLAEYEGKKLPFCSRVIYYVIEESSVQWLKFMNGELDYSGIPKDNFSTAVVNNVLVPDMAEKGIDMRIYPSLDITWTHVNMDDPILGTNRKLRQALSMAYDREKLIEIFYNGRALPAQTIVPPGLDGYDPEYVNPYNQYNVAKAKQLLAEAGYPGGEGLPVFQRQLYSGSSTVRQFFEYLRDSWAAIGVQVEAIPGDWPTYMERSDNGEVQVGGHAWGADYPDAQNFLQLMYGPNKSPGPNCANYDNPEFNALYEKGAFMQQSPERTAIYEKAAQLGAEDCAYMFGVHRLNYYLVNPWLITRVYRDIGAGYSMYYDVDTAMRTEMTGVE